MKAAVDGVSLRYDIHGAGEPVLFVHGFSLSGALWQPVVEPLSGRFKLIIPDLRGHGGSGIGGEASMQRYAADLAALLDEIAEARPVVLVGHSMGGYIAFEFFRRHPERVRALVLVNTRAQADSREAARGRHDIADRVLREGSQVVAD
jgi:3-oxoadipate enol-lactonase